MLKTEAQDDRLIFRIADDGIGAFKKIQQAFGLEDYRESVLELTKGKRTTDPKNHTGQGIFFTSKAVDRFTLSANGIGYIRDNIKDDWWVKTQTDADRPGTGIKLEISLYSTRKLSDIHAQYSSGEDHAFDKTNIKVDLSLIDNAQLISRSEAKRILYKLDEFKHIVLDFKKVKTVGQAFVDEVFRVYQNRHPDVKIEYLNANSDVEFMIRRGNVAG